MVDKNRFKVVTIKDIKEQSKKDKLEELHSYNLNASLSIPSVVNGYSLGVGLIKKWFFNRIKESYFKYWTVDESNYNSAFDRAEQYKNFKIQKPSLLITPRVDTQWNREGLDNNLFGVNTYLRRKVVENSFFKDPINNIYLDMDTEQLRINFTFRVRVSSRSHQLNLLKTMNMKCRIGATETDYQDMDFHIPFDLMCQIAKDVGYKVIDNKIENMQGFISYLNQHSQMPILYRYRKINAKYEFFLRMKQVYTHIDCRDQLDADDGEQLEQTKTNYIITMNCVLDMEIPKFYAYCSKNSHIFNIDSVHEYTIPVNTIQFPDIKDVNEKGWNKYYEIDIEEDDLNKPLAFNFEELFLEETGDISIIKNIIDHNNECYISPSVFIEMKLYNNGQEVDYTINWKNFTIESNNLLLSHITHIVMYLDRKYINDYKINMDMLSDS